MTKSAFTGPVIAYGDRNPPGTGGTGTVNADKAPSIFWGGTAFLDPRVGYNVTRFGCIGFDSDSDCPVIDQVPSAISATNIAASQAVAGAAAFALVTTSGAGITVLATAAVVWASGNTIPVNALVIDTAPGLVAYGIPQISSGYTAVSIYDPTKAIARNVRVTSGGGGDSGTVTLVGADLYGYTQTEAITVVAGSVASGKKAFKFLVSATLSGGGTLSAGSSLGTGDVFGFPLRADSFGYVTVVWIASGGGVAWGTAQTTPFGTASAFTYADATTPATTTTGDVRGTIYVGTQQASDGSKRLQVFITPSVANQGTNAGLFGVTPV